MTKILHIEIKSCCDCPNMQQRKGFASEFFPGWYCTRMNREMEESAMETTPDWCPLEDKENNVKT